jgi:hypothetical protein
MFQEQLMGGYRMPTAYLVSFVKLLRCCRETTELRGVLTKDANSHVNGVTGAVRFLRLDRFLIPPFAPTECSHWSFRFQNIVLCHLWLFPLRILH